MRDFSKSTENNLEVIGPLDPSTNPVLDVELQVDDASIPGNPDDMASLTLSVTAVNQSPTDLTISNASLDENMDTTLGLTVGVLSTIDPDDASGFTYTIVGGVDAGLFAIGGTNADELILDDGLLDFERQASYSVDIQVQDSSANTYLETVVVAVLDVNEMPTITSISDQLITEGGAIGPLAFNVGDAETPAAGLVITAVSSDQNAIPNANISLAGSGANRSVSLLPDTGQFTGPVTITITVDDGANQSQTSFVVGYNQTPVGVPDNYAIFSNSELLSSQGVLVNDIDHAGDVLSAQLISPPAHGTIILASDGRFRYTPDLGFVGTDTFQYVANDGVSSSAPTLVTIAVQPVAAPPAAPPEPDLEETESSDSDQEGPPVGAPLPDPSDADSDDDDQELAGAAHSQPNNDVEINEGTNPFESPTSQPVDEGATISSFAQTINVGSVLTLDGLDPATSSSNRTFSRSTPTMDLSFWADLDLMTESLESAGNSDVVAVGTVTTVASGLTVGYVVWILRGGYLLTSLLTQVPAWSLVDPLPVMDLIDVDEQDEESLQSLVDQGSQQDTSNSTHNRPETSRAEQEASIR